MKMKYTKIIFPLILSLAFILMNSSCKKSNPSEPETPGTTTKSNLIDTTVNNSKNPVQLKISGQLSISIPANTVPDGSKVTVNEKSSTDYPTDNLHKIQKVYDIQISGANVFTNDLTITLNYDPKLLDAGGVKGRLGAAYYDTGLKRWFSFKDVTSDSVLHTVTFKTNHLTHVSFYEFSTNGGLPFKFESSHFTIYYALSGTGKVPDNSSYKAAADSWNNVPGHYDPYYITDLSHWLEDAYEKFASSSVGLKVPTSMVYVYVKPLSGSEGEFGSISGNIYINNNVQVSPELTNLINQPMSLRMTAAHELLHYIQDYYYVMNNAYNQWWLEATATQADRIVWSNMSYYESLGYSKINSKNYGNALHYALSKSWDNNNSESWYAAGCFLSYMANYRSGNKLNIPKVLIKGGNNTEVSYFRTILNNEIKSSLGSDIGKEFQDYVTYLYEAGNTNFNLNWSSVYSPDNKTEIDGNLSKAKPTKKITESIPYLSARIIKLKNTDSDAKNVLISINSLPVETSFAIYKRQGTKMVYETPGQKGSALILDLPVKEFKDLLLINTSNESSATVDVDISFGALTIDPASISKGLLNQKYQFKAVYNGTIPTGVKYIWKVLPDNVSAENTTGIFEYTFTKPGSYTIELTMFDKDNKLLDKSSSSVSIAPSISYLDPSKGKPGDHVIIYGSNFGTNSSLGSVTFGGVKATEINLWTNTFVNATVPASAVTGDIIVTVNNVASNGMPFEVQKLDLKKATGFSITIPCGPAHSVTMKDTRSSSQFTYDETMYTLEIPLYTQNCLTWSGKNFTINYTGTFSHKGISYLCGSGADDYKTITFNVTGSGSIDDQNKIVSIRVVAKSQFTYVQRKNTEELNIELSNLTLSSPTIATYTVSKSEASGKIKINLFDDRTYSPSSATDYSSWIINSTDWSKASSSDVCTLKFCLTQ